MKVIHASDNPSILKEFCPCLFKEKREGKMVERACGDTASFKIVSDNGKNFMFLCEKHYRLLLPSLSEIDKLSECL